MHSLNYIPHIFSSNVLHITVPRLLRVIHMTGMASLFVEDLYSSLAKAVLHKSRQAATKLEIGG